MTDHLTGRSRRGPGVRTGTRGIANGRHESGGIRLQRRLTWGARRPPGYGDPCTKRVDRCPLVRACHPSAAARGSGGVWDDDQAIQHLGITQATLENWREQRSVLALRRHDGSFAYPVGQFERASSDTTRPHPAILAIGAVVAA